MSPAPDISIEPRQPPRDPAERAAILEAIAGSLDDSRTRIIDLAAEETALHQAELAPEFDRMTGTLRMFAALLRKGSWVHAAIDPADGAAHGRPLIGPANDVRAMLVPLGPVAVFGASNFPLAYGVCGGDTASALAAGCAVIVKEHPAHPRTGRLIHAVASEGIRSAGGDAAMLGYIRNEDPADFSAATALVRHPAIKAVGFTGSGRAGLALEDLARERPDRIPVFSEMGSANPVLITPAAATARGDAIAAQLADAILARFGQQCTCPGIIILPGAGGAARPLVEALAARLAAAPSRDMLAPWVRDGYTKRLDQAVEKGGAKLLAGGREPIGRRAARAALLSTTVQQFSEHPTLREEIFGPAAIVVDAPVGSLDEVMALPLPASLTLSVYFQSDDADDTALVREWLAAFAPIVGRIIFNGVPTGVRVAAGMVHGGPFPSSNRPDTTAVGPRAIERWCRPLCWQGAPVELLPDELRPPSA